MPASFLLLPWRLSSMRVQRPGGQTPLLSRSIWEPASWKGVCPLSAATVEKTMSYQLVIGDKNISSWSLRPWLAMRQVGIPFEEINVKLRQPESQADILRYSPSGRVPTLLTDSQAIWDSLSILEYLAEAHPEARLWPQAREARALARSAAAEMHSGFAALREHCSMD